MIAACGIACHDCDAYIATLTDDNKLRAQVAQEWSEIYNASISTDQIQCMGCRSEGPYFFHCQNCEIRTCSDGKKMENCGMCEDYPCEKLDMIFTHVPEAKARLDAVHAKLIF